MFYTKYRPQKFSDLSKPSDIADILANQIINKKNVHAYLLVGPRGTGKTSIARILAKALNCEHLDKTGDPCDMCDTCVSIRNGTFLDLIEIDAASNRGIDDIRELKDKIRLAPSLGKNKVYIIDEVHMLTTEAFNALLKTLEEPPKNTTIILCTTEFHKVPETIKSRCQVFRFKRATNKQIVDKLKQIATKEKHKMSEEDLEKVAYASMGGFRDAETLLQQIIEGGVSAEGLLSVSGRQTYIDFVSFISQNDITNSLKMVNKVYEEGLDLYVWAGELIKYLRDLLLIKSGYSEADLDVNTDVLNQMKSSEKHLSVAWLVKTLNVLVVAQNQIRNSFISQLPLELAVVDICGFQEASAPLGSTNDSKSTTTTITKPTTKSKMPSKVVKTEAAVETVEDADVESELTQSEAIENEVEESTSDAFTVDSEDENETTIEIIKEKWEDLLASVKAINSSIFGLLKSSNPIKLDGKNLILEVFYTFHKDRLESPRNRKIVEDILKEIHQFEIGLKCMVSGEKPSKLKNGEVGYLTDRNIVPAGAEIKFNKNSVIEMLDGGLPLV